MGASDNATAHKDTIDPTAWAIVDGKLYFTHNQYWLNVWKEKAAEHIKQADRDWEAVKKLPAPEIVGPPCAASPPTTKVASRDGGHWVVVAGQLPRDEAGNVVGKGDLKAQIEQVGKNVGACLAAGGASVKDIVSYVTQPAEFIKYADLRLRYFGPPTPQSAILPVPQLAGRDYLVQVEELRRHQVGQGHPYRSGSESTEDRPQYARGRTLSGSPACYNNTTATVGWWGY
jgi:enamine deaminase RidA (YjgF/YER057c/UK114 family)